MKNLLSIWLLIFLFTGLRAQITLEQSYNYSATITKINETDYKYFLMDVPQKQCRIYNLDFSLYKTINLSVPAENWLYDIRFVSEDLFNSDDKIELIYTYYTWVVTNVNNGNGYYVYHSKIVNEDGVVLLDIPGALYNYIKETSPDEYSLFLYLYDYSVNPYTIKTNIYKLPGKPNEIKEAKKSFSGLNLYPNPASDYITVDYSLPEGVSTGTLKILDSSGREHSAYIVDGFMDHLQLYTGDFLPGIYYYVLETPEGKGSLKKLIVR